MNKPTPTSETWDWISGYEGLYKASTQGQIWSQPRQNTRGGVLKQRSDRWGYLRVTLTKNSVQRSYLVHVLVAETFLGPRPKGAPLVRHLDGDPGNNDVANLAFGNFTQNAADTVRHGRHGWAGHRPNPPRPREPMKPVTVKSLPGEIWVDVIGFEGLYRISSFGRVLSLPRNSTKGGLMALHRHPRSGAVSVMLTKNGRPTRHRVHRLVMEAFVGPMPQGMEVRHLDGVAHNNHVSNLAYSDHATNMKDIPIHGTWLRNKTHCKHGHKFTPENTRFNKRGHRQCRACEKMRRPGINERRRAKRRQLRAAA